MSLIHLLPRDTIVAVAFLLVYKHELGITHVF